MSVVDINPTLEGAVQQALDAVTNNAGRVVRIRPGANGDGYPLLDWVLSPLPETCERENIGLAIDYVGAAPPWDDVVRFSRAYPGLPIILVGAAIGQDGVIPAALDVAPNLVLALSAERDRNSLARLVERFGAHRFTERLDAFDAGTWREAHL